MKKIHFILGECCRILELFIYLLTYFLEHSLYIFQCPNGRTWWGMWMVRTLRLKKWVTCITLPYLSSGSYSLLVFWRADVLRTIPSRHVIVLGLSVPLSASMLSWEFCCFQISAVYNMLQHSEDQKV